MATLSQLPAQLNYSGVAGNPINIVFNITLTDSSGHTIPWSDVTGYQVDITDQFGIAVSGATPTITSPEAYQLNVGWTASQSTIISNAQTPRMALSIYISGNGPYALAAGVIALSPPEYPAAS